MKERFSKTIRINDYLKLNISNKGVSFTAGKKGASITLGEDGAFLDLSPSAFGVKGTGKSYRKKITGDLKESTKKYTGEEKRKTPTIKRTNTDLKSMEKSRVDTSVIDQYAQESEMETNIHKYTDNVISKEEYKANIVHLENETMKAIYLKSVHGDKDTIESLIGSFIQNRKLNYEVNINYELEGPVLYADLDLPEIESLKVEYPVIKDNQIVFKKKTSKELKEEYRRLVMSVGIYLTANFFNLSGYIETVVLSAFTKRRNKAGDLINEYIYSVRYKREIFEKTNLAKLDDLYEFICLFENRIHPLSNGNLKAIEPFEKESVVKTNIFVEDALAGLKTLGYKAEDINSIKEELSAMKLSNSGDYLKAGLKILSQKK